MPVLGILTEIKRNAHLVSKSLSRRALEPAWEEKVLLRRFILSHRTGAALVGCIGASNCYASAAFCCVGDAFYILLDTSAVICCAGITFKESVQRDGALLRYTLHRIALLTVLNAWICTGSH